MPYAIQIKPKGFSIQATQDETILEAAGRQGYEIPYGCRSGRCASCKAVLVNGKVDFTDTQKALNRREAKDGFILTCQARALTDLELLFIEK